MRSHMTLLALAAPALGSAPVCVTDCCDTTCLETSRKFDFPAQTDADHSFKFSTSGVLSKDVPAATWTMAMTGMGMKINLSPSTGDACGGQTEIKVEGGTFGSMMIDFSDGGKVSCPMKAGSAVGSVGTSTSPSDPPGSGKFVTTTKTFAADGTMISCQIIQVGGSCAAPPPAPAPGAQLYTCVNNQCVAGPSGVPKATCAPVCHPLSSAGPPIPDPYDSGCAAKTDCESCLATQVAGPVPIPGLKQNCGWCLKTGQCHDDISLSNAKCALDCTAKRLPAFDGPVCPYATCNPKKYTCTAGKCVATGDQHSGNGTSLAVCEAECAIAPKPPAQVLYQCASGQCTESASGIDLDTCQALCQPQPPAPPAPGVKQYQCAAGQCAESATGIDLQTCQQLCHPPTPPAPTPPAPATQYQCDSGKCTESATGIDLKTCQAVCH